MLPLILFNASTYLMLKLCLELKMLQIDLARFNEVVYHVDETKVLFFKEYPFALLIGRGFKFLNYGNNSY